MDNAEARAFYSSLGYASAGETEGRDVVRSRWSYDSAPVKRAVMSRSLRGSGAGDDSPGAEERPGSPAATERAVPQPG